jgi:DNA-binding CsgD family transcriptional regulator/PAS domain-containing protein
MDVHDRVIAILQLLYAAPGNQDGWHRVLSALCDDMGASGAAFVSHNPAAVKGDVTSMARFDPDAVREYVAQWGALDPWAHASVIQSLAPGTVTIGDQLVPHDKMVRTPYYNDFGRRFDITQCIVGILEVEPHALSCLTLNGSERRGPFALDDYTLFTALMPHLQRALQMHRRLAGASVFAVATMDTLDHLPHCLLLVTVEGRVLFVNRRAALLLQARDGLTLDGHELRAATVADTDALRAAIRTTAATAAGASLAAAPCVRVGRPSGRRPYAVMIAPVSPPSDGSSSGERPALLVAITDPDRRPQAAAEVMRTDDATGVDQTSVTDQDVIRRLFGLTPGEARLARLIAEGATLREAAMRLGWREQSARTRLKTVLDKTGTHRQAELVRLILNVTARL